MKKYYVIFAFIFISSFFISHQAEAVALWAMDTDINVPILGTFADHTYACVGSYSYCYTISSSGDGTKTGGTVNQVGSVSSVTAEYAKVIIAHSNLDIDKKFGVDFPVTKREKLNTVQRTMLDEKLVIDKLYKTGAISLDEYMKRAAQAVETSLSSAAAILSDYEFKSLFGMSKSEIKGSFYKATQYTPPVED